MQPIEARGQAEVGAVVHDQLDVRSGDRSQARFEFTRVVEHLTAVAGFVAVLQQGAAGGGEFFGGGKHGIGVRETVGVEDGV